MITRPAQFPSIFHPLSWSSCRLHILMRQLAKEWGLNPITRITISKSVMALVFLQQLLVSLEQWDWEKWTSRFQRAAAAFWWIERRENSGLIQRRVYYGDVCLAEVMVVLVQTMERALHIVPSKQVRCMLVVHSLAKCQAQIFQNSSTVRKMNFPNGTLSEVSKFIEWYSVASLRRFWVTEVAFLQPPQILSVSS